MYTTLKEVTKTAEALNFTVGAFNTHNLEMLPSMLRAAKEMGHPSSFKQVSIRRNTSAMMSWSMSSKRLPITS